MQFTYLKKSQDGYSFSSVFRLCFACVLLTTPWFRKEFLNEQFASLHANLYPGSAIGTI